jgi:hypothetical protein
MTKHYQYWSVFKNYLLKKTSNPSVPLRQIQSFVWILSQLAYSFQKNLTYTSLDKLGQNQNLVNAKKNKKSLL